MGPAFRMVLKIQEVQADLTSKADQVQQVYAEGVVNGFTDQ